MNMRATRSKASDPIEQRAAVRIGIGRRDEFAADEAEDPFHGSSLKLKNGLVCITPRPGPARCGPTVLGNRLILRLAATRHTDGTDRLAGFNNRRPATNSDKARS